MTDHIDTAQTGAVPEELISTMRHPAVRYRVGWDYENTFGIGSGYDGMTLTIEVADMADAWEMLADISAPLDALDAMQARAEKAEAARDQAVDAAVPTDAARDVLAERQRQIEAEGWTPEHDDHHDAGQMAGAALCYLAEDIPHWARQQAHGCYWLWDAEWWKPADHRRNLVKAGALILAEIERLDRAALKRPEASHE